MSNADKDGKGGGQDNKFQITVSFNGINKPLEVNKNQAVQSVISRALELFQQSAGTVGLFLGGAELQPNTSVEAAGITPGAILLLRPRQVRGG
jgi:hypothetical protein